MERHEDPLDASFRLHFNQYLGEKANLSDFRNFKFLNIWVWIYHIDNLVDRNPFTFFIYKKIARSF